MGSDRSIKRELEQKKAGCLPEVREAINDYVNAIQSRFASEVLSITLYGSQARGDADIESDIDLLVIILQDRPSIRKGLIDLAWQIQYEHDIVVSDVIRSREQWNLMRNQRFPYYLNIQDEGIILWKNPSEPTRTYA